MTTTTTTETPRVRTTEDDRRAFTTGQQYAVVDDVGTLRHLRKSFTESLVGFSDRDTEILQDVFQSGYRTVLDRGL